MVLNASFQEFMHVQTVVKFVSASATFTHA